MSDTSKLIVAFFLGLAIALGSVFFFMRSSQPPAALAAVNPPVQTTPTAPAPAPAAPVEQPLAKFRNQLPVKTAKPEKAKPERNPEPVNAPRPAVTKTPDQEPAATSTGPAAPSSFAAPPAAPAFTPEPAAPVQQQPHTITLRAGTAFNVRLEDSVSTERNSSGDNFRATLTAPVIVDGFVIVERGSKVQGQVVEAERSGRVKGRANVSLALTEINTTDGQRVRVQTNSVIREASASKGSDTAKIAAGSALGALIGGLTGGGKGAAIGAGAGGAAGTGVVLGTRGKGVTLPNETALTFKLVSPVTITEQFHN